LGRKRREEERREEEEEEEGVILSKRSFKRTFGLDEDCGKMEWSGGCSGRCRERTLSLWDFLGWG